MDDNVNDTDPYRKTLLRAVSVTKRFGALAALGGVDFDVPRHGIVSLIGPNGAGKTVLFNVFTGLIKPDGGTIWFNGQRITGTRPDRITTLGIARTFQSTRLFKNMTVLENVLVGQHCRLQGGVLDAVLRSDGMLAEEADATGRSMELLRFVGLDSWARSAATNISYGDGRRLEIARALATNPQLLLLDEPTAGMNPQETADMIALIGRVRRDMGVAIMLIEHDMKVVMRISDRVSVLDYGLKIAEGTPEEVRNDARVIEAYLGRSAPASLRANEPQPIETSEGLQMKPRPLTT